ncbi:MAG: 30S ribosomal protein S20 [Candidatus Liptonbacteria bacterium]|nr:30S ribosomal protein S20 [Candidatus Liptonbacteria bacterium]
MPITSSAKKALRQSARRKVQNIIRKDAYKDAVKTYRKLIADKKIEEAKVALAKAFQTLDKTAKTGVIKSNKADRLKSRLSIKLNPPTPRTPSSA